MPRLERSVAGEMKVDGCHLDCEETNSRKRLRHRFGNGDATAHNRTSAGNGESILEIRGRVRFGIRREQRFEIRCIGLRDQDASVLRGKGDIDSAPAPQRAPFTPYSAPEAHAAKERSIAGCPQAATWVDECDRDEGTDHER